MNKNTCVCCNNSCLVNKSVLRRLPNLNRNSLTNFGSDGKRKFIIHFRIKYKTANHKVLSVRLRLEKCARI